MAYKKAGLKTQEEAEQRLKSGETFYHNGKKLKYDASYIRRGMSPFRFGSDSIRNLWEMVNVWETTCEWYESIPASGILCWVRDNRSDDWFLSTVTHKSDSAMYPFNVDYTTSYRYAKPATLSSIQGLLTDEV